MIVRKFAFIGLAAGAAALVSVGANTGALAADMPVKAAPVVYTSGYYVWLDGSYQSIKLPTFGLGMKYADPTTFVDRGVTTTYDPRATGGGGAGGIGYLLPHGTFFGSNARIELGGSYVHAKASQATSSTPGTVFTTPLVSGLVTALVGCAPCYNTSTLSSSYTAWQGNLKGASDFKYGSVTLTPSLSVFGGQSRNSQGFTEGFGFVGFPQFPASSYTSDSSVRWTDLGAKIGLDAKVDVTNWATLGVGGSVGFAGRHTSMSANDACKAFCTFGNFTSSVSASSSSTPFLANAEINAAFHPWANTTFKAFAGLNYDSGVPGISAPSYSGPASGAGAIQGTPAGIYFSRETSYYAGAGLLVKFGS